MPKAKFSSLPLSVKEQLADSAAMVELEAIFGSLRGLLAKEYERGGTNAAARILSLVGGPSNALRPNTVGEGSTTIKRAPRGAARLLVERALATGPKSIQEIRDVAETPVEKVLSYQTVRLELERGKGARKYRKTKDGWALLIDKG